jgi:hypothetical protein
MTIEDESIGTTGEEPSTTFLTNEDSYLFLLELAKVVRDVNHIGCKECG